MKYKTNERGGWIIPSGSSVPGGTTIPPNSESGPHCWFGPRCEFGHCCTFDRYCKFDHHCNFGPYCKFRARCVFGHTYGLGPDCKFGPGCKKEEAAVKEEPGLPLSSRLDAEQILPERKEGWAHSRQVLVWYPRTEERGATFGIAFYHYAPPFDEPPHWVDWSGKSYGRNPRYWWELPVVDKEA